MSKDYLGHIISINANARSALQQLDNLPNSESRTLFVTDEEYKLLGTLTDGDIRRGLLKDREITDNVSLYMNGEYKFLQVNDIDPLKVKEYISKDINLAPVLDKCFKIVRIIDIKSLKTVLPVSVLIMAGGRGERLKPLTDHTPKPMLKVGDKPILEHTIDRLIKYGITDYHISVRYLSDQIINYFGKGEKKNISISYITESTPLGTVGAFSLLENVRNEHVLIMNSDILTNIDFEDFYQYYLNNKAAMCLASVPYNVKIPYGVLEGDADNKIHSLKEKPTYTYYSNAGIYFLRNHLNEHVPKNIFFNATDLMDKLISCGQNVMHYPILNYWLDIGKYEDFLKAQHDIQYLKDTF